jgi:predicted HTH domain antitoxin
MPYVSAETLRDTMTFLSERLRAGKPDEALRLELLARGFEEKLAELYEQFQRSECSFGYMAEQLGVTTWDLYNLLERRGLRTTNL